MVTTCVTNPLFRTGMVSSSVTCLTSRSRCPTHSEVASLLMPLASCNLRPLALVFLALAISDIPSSLSHITKTRTNMADSLKNTLFFHEQPSTGTRVAQVVGITASAFLAGISIDLKTMPAIEHALMASYRSHLHLHLLNNASSAPRTSTTPSQAMEEAIRP